MAAVEKKALIAFDQCVAAAIWLAEEERFDSHGYRVKKIRRAALFLFLMKGHLIALGAEFLDFHLIGVVSLVAGGDVVLISADGASQDDLIAFAGHCLSLSSLLGLRIIA